MMVMVMMMILLLLLNGIYHESPPNVHFLPYHFFFFYYYYYCRLKMIQLLWLSSFSSFVQGRKERRSRRRFLGGEKRILHKNPSIVHPLFQSFFFSRLFSAPLWNKQPFPPQKMPIFFFLSSIWDTYCFSIVFSCFYFKIFFDSFSSLNQLVSGETIWRAGALRKLMARGLIHSILLIDFLKKSMDDIFKNWIIKCFM